MYHAVPSSNCLAARAHAYALWAQGSLHGAVSGVSRREWIPLDQIVPLLYSGRVIGQTYQRMRSDSPVV